MVFNLFSAALSALVIARFEDTIAQMAVLAGTQALAVSVRALAARSLTSANARRAVLREMVAGLISGLALIATLGVAALAGFWRRWVCKSWGLTQRWP